MLHETACYICVERITFKKGGMTWNPSIKIFSPNPNSGKRVFCSLWLVCIILALQVFFCYPIHLAKRFPSFPWQSRYSLYSVCYYGISRSTPCGTNGLYHTPFFATLLTAGWRAGSFARGSFPWCGWCLGLLMQFWRRSSSPFGYVFCGNRMMSRFRTH